METVIIENLPYIESYGVELDTLIAILSDIRTVLQYLLCLVFVFVIVLVCRFAYKHFNQFFV